MVNPLLLLGGLFLATIATPEAHAQSAWSAVRQYLQPGVRVERQSDDVLVLTHGTRRDTLVLTTANTPDAEPDIQGRLVRRRGSNPYRIWVATPQFWNDADRPRQMWGRYFRAEFLRLIRPPGATS